MKIITKVPNNLTNEALQTQLSKWLQEYADAYLDHYSKATINKYSLVIGTWINCYCIENGNNDINLVSTSDINSKYRAYINSHQMHDYPTSFCTRAITSFLEYLKEKDGVEFKYV